MDESRLGDRHRDHHHLPSSALFYEGEGTRAEDWSKIGDLISVEEGVKEMIEWLDLNQQFRSPISAAAHKFRDDFHRYLYASRNRGISGDDAGSWIFRVDGECEWEGDSKERRRQIPANIS